MTFREFTKTQRKDTDALTEINNTSYLAQVEEINDGSIMLTEDRKSDTNRDSNFGYNFQAQNAVQKIINQGSVDNSSMMKDNTFSVKQIDASPLKWPFKFGHSEMDNFLTRNKYNNIKI